jgi:hypothetical protein
VPHYVPEMVADVRQVGNVHVSNRQSGLQGLRWSWRTQRYVRALEMAAKGARASGTPFLNFYAPTEILTLARAAGFQTVQHVSAELPHSATSRTGPTASVHRAMPKDCWLQQPKSWAHPISHWLNDLNRDRQIGRWNSRCVFPRAYVLTLEQFFQLSLQLPGAPAAFCCFGHYLFSLAYLFLKVRQEGRQNSIQSD